MGFDIASLLGGSIGDAFVKIMGVFKVDPTTALQKQTEIEEIKLSLASKLQDQFNQQLQSQTDINKQEAASPNWFVAGWRPAVGWVCVAGLASQFAVAPFATWVATLVKHPIVYPNLDTGTLLTLLFGMLGMGGFRTYEKTQGVDAAHPVE